MEGYWIRPIPFQNPNPSLISPFLKGGPGGLSLYPEACGECHKEQYTAWQDSLHSKAVGPGFLSQLDPEKDPGFAPSCYYCHAPMMEQSEVENQQSIVDSPQSELKNRKYVQNLSFDKKLKLSGVSCAVCHLRRGKVYGPPTKKTVSSRQSAVSSEGQKSHNGFIKEDFFEKAEFCAACHQLDEGYELNGKVLTNTYREWKDSIYGKNNITCQTCHMPDRRHLFRGIHDPDMVKNGLKFEATYDKTEKSVKARLTITNTGIGHFFPTYVTPLVVVKGFLANNRGDLIKGTLKEAFIGRKVSLNLNEEYFDTRIPPLGDFKFDYDSGDSYKASKLLFEVWVYPDEFYHEFYKTMLKEKQGINKKDLQIALNATESSVYLLFRKEIEIKDISRPLR